MKQIKVLELFGGIGAPRKALENLFGAERIKHIDYVEIKDFAILAYNNLFNNNYQAQSIINWDLNVDILIHGSPCQDFSIAGKNDISTGRSILYNETLDIIGNRLNVRPKAVIWENVKGLLNKNNIQHFNHYLETMKSFGYKNHYKVLNSKDFGIPQSRNRVFVISILKGQELFNNDFNFDNLEKIEMKQLKEFLDDNVDTKYYLTQTSMAKAIQNNKCKILTQNDLTETITTKQLRWNNAGVLAIEIKDFNNFITIPRQSDGKLINGSYNRIWKLDKYVGTISASKQEKIAVPIIDKPIAGVDIFIINDKPYHLRILTEKECWKLMGFKDKDFNKIKNLMSSSKLYDLAGNSIVVNVLEAIFKELIKEQTQQIKLKLLESEKN